MRARAKILAAAFWSMAVLNVSADQVVQSVQQKLKDAGFYYGEISGTQNSETTAAIRRYQIRNGLQITGDLTVETQKSLGVRGAPPPIPRPTPAATPTMAPHQIPSPQRSDLRDDGTVTEEVEADSEQSIPQVSLLTTAALFAGTPFARASADEQQAVIAGAQAHLSRRGYYRSEIDGVFGPGTEFALRAYQSRFGIRQTGRLDTETLASLGLLPGQRAPGVTTPSRRVYRPPSYYTPDGERVYLPR